MLRLIALILALCASSEGAPAHPPTPAVPNDLAGLSILDLMSTRIDPAADRLWRAVAFISTKDGTVQRQPRTRSEWQQQRYYALTLINSSAVLMLPHRVVGHAGQSLADPGAGDYTPAQSLAAIRQDPRTFVAFARVLNEAARSAVRAIERRNANELLAAGGDIDDACERCHRRFWYPTAVSPTPN